MSYSEPRKVKLKKEVLRFLFKPLSTKAVQRLVKSWGFETVGDLKKEEIINILKGKEVILPKFLDLLLLYDQNTVFKHGTWYVYKYNNTLENIDARELERVLNEKLAGRGKAVFNVFEISRNKEYYIIYLYEEGALLVQQWDYNYRVVKPVAHIRGILNLEKQTLLIGGDSNKKLEEFRKTLQKALATKFTPVRFPPYVLQEIAENESVERASFACDSQLSGVKGIQKITIEGDNVFDGIKGLKARQEIDFRRVGPLIEAETSKVYASTEGKVILKDKKAKNRILKKISEAQ